jgi:hypothetical protein
LGDFPTKKANQAITSAAITIAATTEAGVCIRLS